MNVYEASVERMEYVFDNFDSVYVSFSGGKDSGVLLNIAIDEARRRKRMLDVLFIDIEAHYEATALFAERMITTNRDVVRPYWVCLPMTTTNAVSMYEPWWTWWAEEDRSRWVRSIPPGAIHLGNNPFDFYRYGMTFEDFIEEFAIWMTERQGPTACLVGIRTEESLNRWRALHREDKATYSGLNWSTQIKNGSWRFYPIYDWTVEDIWTYNGRFSKDYNRLYDLMYQAGVPLHSMRVCEPYGDEQKAGLNLYRILEPKTWVRVVERVSGANFGSTYCNTKATGTRHITLPPNHSWRTYCKYLLNTLPLETAEQYRRKFRKFIQYWHYHGSPLPDDQIDMLVGMAGSDVVNTRLFSSRGRGDKHVVKFLSIPDELPGLDNKSDYLSWKRMCMAILKNDITCRSLSFSITKQQRDRREAVMLKYQGLL